MDTNTFDTVVKLVGSGGTRRAVLRALVASLIAGLLGQQGARAQLPPKFCGHAVGPNGGCMGACTSAGFTGAQCGVICGTGQSTGACPVGQGGNNPCCNFGLCDPDNFPADSNGNPVYTGPMRGCLCGHSVGPSGGCMGACTKADFTGNQCNDICGNGQTTGACPVGQGGDNPCCNPGYCGPTNYEANASGDPVYTGPTTGCPA